MSTQSGNNSQTGHVMSDPIRILHIEDDATDALLIREIVNEAGLCCRIMRIQTDAELRSALLLGDFDLILADYNLPAYDGISALRLARDWRPDLPFIFVSGVIGEDAAIEALTQGATDYVLKQNLSRLIPAIQRALDDAKMRRDHQRAEDAQRRLNRELRAVSACHQSLLRAEDESTLLETICKIVCQEAGYHAAWVGFALHGSGRDVDATVGYRYDGEHSFASGLSESESQLWRFFANSTVRSGEIACIQDIEPILEPLELREYAKRLGFKSAIALPLKNESNETFAVLCIISEERNAFTSDEVRLLAELANDLAFGIVTLRNRLERKRAEDELKRAEQKRRQLERELFQSQKLESLGTLASGIAHDFNNILAIIIGHAASLDEPELTKEGYVESVQSIQTAAFRGAALVKQLLTFARKGETRFEPISINNVIRELMALLRETFPKTIEVHTLLADGIGSITGDATQLHQMILNLCVNARDAMPNGGRLSIATKVVELDAVLSDSQRAAANEYVLVSVSDSGSGMDEETKRRMFEPFYTTKALGKGTGLGLALVHSIVENHHGVIAVESRLGIGTTFRVYFPLRASCCELHTLTHEPVDDLRCGSETILVIEDEEMLAKIAKDWLTARGYRVLIAHDGEEAISVFTHFRQDIAVVVSDYGLPKSSGEQVFYRIRALAPNTKFIIASGYLEPVVRARLLEAGIFQVLQKPYLSADLISAVQNAVHHLGEA